MDMLANVWKKKKTTAQLQYASVSTRLTAPTARRACLTTGTDHIAVPTQMMLTSASVSFTFSPAAATYCC